MESGWFVKSSLSKREGSVATLPDRSYQISPIAPSSWRALLQGRRSTTPQDFGRACARARSMVITRTLYSSEKTNFVFEQQNDFSNVGQQRGAATWGSVEIFERS